MDCENGMIVHPFFLYEPAEFTVQSRDATSRNMPQKITGAGVGPAPELTMS